MILPEKATRPTMYFIGVTTGKSSIMKVFPLWAEAIGLEGAVLRGIDIAIHADPEDYRDAVSFIKDDALSLGALVTTHKLDLYNAAYDLFDYLDPYALKFGEISSISKKDGWLEGYAKDPISSGLAMKAFIPEEFFKEHSGHVFIMGAGAARWPSAHITGEVVEKASASLKVISRYGAGYDRVDINAAKRRNIVVTNTPGVNSNSVADLAFALMLAVARRIPLLDKKVKEGNWPRVTGTEVYNKTLGIVGLGAIGKGVALRAKGFSMRVLAYDPYADKAFAEENGIFLVSFDELVRQADYISLHLPLNEHTRNIISEDAISKMKRGAILVNTARGSLIDEVAAYNALVSGHLGGLGLDAFEKEPPEISPLFFLDNVVTTPHAGAHTAEAVAGMGVMSVQNLINVLSGKPCPNIVNR